MASPAVAIQLPEDLQEFADELVRAGEYASVADVVRGALEAKKLQMLREALDVGITELDRGEYFEGTVDEFMAEISQS